MSEHNTYFVLCRMVTNNKAYKNFEEKSNLNIMSQKFKLHLRISEV